MRLDISPSRGLVRFIDALFADVPSLILELQLGRCDATIAGLQRRWSAGIIPAG
jgi:hypothetical protein